jgi:hypothetical protein
VLYKQRRVKTVWMIEIRRSAFFHCSVSLVCTMKSKQPSLGEKTVREENAPLLPSSLACLPL